MNTMVEEEATDLMRNSKSATLKAHTLKIAFKRMLPKKFLRGHRWAMRRIWKARKSNNLFMKKVSRNNY